MTGALVEIGVIVEARCASLVISGSEMDELGNVMHACLVMRADRSTEAGERDVIRRTFGEVQICKCLCPFGLPHANP